MSDAQIWIRSLKHHTYWNIARDPGTFYAVDNEQDAETIAALGLGTREAPPPRAVRTTEGPDVLIVPLKDTVRTTDLTDVMSTESTGGALTPDDRIDLTPRLRRMRKPTPPVSSEG